MDQEYGNFNKFNQTSGSMMLIKDDEPDNHQMHSIPSTLSGAINIEIDSQRAIPSQKKGILKNNIAHNPYMN